MRYIRINGETKVIAEWAREVGISREAMRMRVNKYGEEAGEILLKEKDIRAGGAPKGVPHNSKHRRLFGGSISELSDKLGVTDRIIHKTIQEVMELLEDDLNNDRWLDAEACALLSGKQERWNSTNTTCILCPLFSRGWCLKKPENQARFDGTPMEVFKDVKENIFDK